MRGGTPYSLTGQAILRCAYRQSRTNLPANCSTNIRANRHATWQSRKEPANFRLGLRERRCCHSPWNRTSKFPFIRRKPLQSPAIASPGHIRSFLTV